MTKITVPDKTVAVRPVGVVVSDYTEVSLTFDYAKESMIYMREDLAEALTGLESFSHMHVIYHQHRREELRDLPGYNKIAPPWTIPVPGEANGFGIYSTRSPFRPSALGSCVVEIIKREGNRIYVTGLDALNGTPVMDIKIYVPRYDAFPFAEVPLGWQALRNQDSTSRHLNWDAGNVGLALGLKAGTGALQILGLQRGGARGAEIKGGHFFAQGIEGATGCSFLRREIQFTELKDPIKDWQLRLIGPDGMVIIRLKDRCYAGADEVLAADNDLVFSVIGPEQSPPVP